MVLGAITCTNLGIVSVTGSALKTLMDAQNCGAATAGAETSSFIITYIGNGQVHVTKIARAGA